MEHSVVPEACAARSVSGPRGAPDDGRQQAVVGAVAVVTRVLSSAVLITLPSVFRLLQPGDQLSTFSSPVLTVFADRQSDSSLCSSPSNLFVRADDGSFRSRGFENRSYSIVLPVIPQQERSEFGTHGELICDPAFRAADGNGVMSNGQQLLPHLLLTSASLPLVDTDMSYQVHNPDSVQFPHVGDSKWSPVSGIDNAGEKFILHEERRSYGGVPAGSVMDMDFTYQTFESLVEPSGVLALEKCSTEEPSGGHPDEPRAATPEPISRAGVSGCTDNASTFQAPFLSLLSADQSTPVILESGYQSVSGDVCHC